MVETPTQTADPQPLTPRSNAKHHQNRAWRWWFPRGTRLDNLDQTHVDHVATIINKQRRRNLDHHSPASLYAAATVH